MESLDQPSLYLELSGQDSRGRKLGWRLPLKYNGTIGFYLPVPLDFIDDLQEAGHLIKVTGGTTSIKLNGSS